MRLSDARDFCPKAFSMHVAMNIADKDAFAREVARVLKPGGRFALYDQMLNPAPPESTWEWLQKKLGLATSPAFGDGDLNQLLSYPLPWAATPLESHCTLPESYVQAFGAAGYVGGMFSRPTASWLTPLSWSYLWVH